MAHKKTQLARYSGSGVRHLTFSGVPTSHLLGGSPSRQLEPPDRVSSNPPITSARGFAITSARGFGGSTSHLHAADDTHPLTFTLTNPPSRQQGGTSLTFKRWRIPHADAIAPHQMAPPNRGRHAPLWRQHSTSWRQAVTSLFLELYWLPSWIWGGGGGLIWNNVDSRRIIA